jgi:hypothetical protein
VVGLRTYKAECCSKCGTHPSVNQPGHGGDPNALVAVWKHCRTCELVEAAQEAGPPEPSIKGWHLVVQRRDGTDVTKHKHA